MVLALTAWVLAQRGGQGGNSGDDPRAGVSSKCDACGASSTYSEAIAYDGIYEKRTITANGCPNHYSYCTGKVGPPGCGGIGEEGTDTEAAPQGKTIDIPARPVIASYAAARGPPGLARPT